MKLHEVIKKGGLYKYPNLIILDKHYKVEKEIINFVDKPVEYRFIGESIPNEYMNCEVVMFRERESEICDTDMFAEVVIMDKGLKFWNHDITLGQLYDLLFYVDTFPKLDVDIRDKDLEYIKTMNNAYKKDFTKHELNGVVISQGVNNLYNYVTTYVVEITI